MDIRTIFLQQIYLSICLSICLAIYLPTYLAIYLINLDNFLTSPQIIVSVHAPVEITKPWKIGFRYAVLEAGVYLGYWVEWKVKYRSSRPEVLRQKVVLRNFAKLIGKHLCQILFFNKVAGLRPATLLKRRLLHRCFPVNFRKLLRTPFLKEHLQWLLLQIIHRKTAMQGTEVSLNILCEWL